MLVSWWDFAYQLGTWVSGAAALACVGNSNASWGKCMPGSNGVIGISDRWGRPVGLVMGRVVERALLDPSRTEPWRLPWMKMLPWMRLMTWLQVMIKA